MPVSMWSHGSGASRRESASAPRSTLPFPPPPWPRYSPSPSFSSTSHSPFTTCRYFHVRPASSMARSNDLNDDSAPSHHVALCAPSSHDLRTTSHSERSPLPMKSSMALIRMDVQLDLTLGTFASASFRSLPRLANSSVDTECHWNGVCGFGVKLERVRVSVSLSRLRALLPPTVFWSQSTVSAMPSTSASVSPGKPIIKYSLTFLQPLSYAVCTPWSNSSFVSPLLTISRSRWVPASGANVSPALPAPPSMSAMESSNRSILCDGSESVTFSSLSRFLISSPTLGNAR
mmetsp:Transcript_3080/g.11463  ORF Transcript_3080/g.11463 Transcript_3080/m.11463 type:complete len:289 (-) Transcript_3080:1302-2168(-)